MLAGLSYIHSHEDEGRGIAAGTELSLAPSMKPPSF